MPPQSPRPDGFAGLLFAVLLSSVADALVRLSGMGHGIALGVTVLVVIAGTVGTAWALWPSVSTRCAFVNIPGVSPSGIVKKARTERERRWISRRISP